MTSQQIFELLRSFGKKERKNLTVFLRSQKGEMPQVLLLYERIKVVKKWSEQVELRVRGKEFRKSDTYYHVRQRLVRKIIQCFAHFDREEYPTIGFIEKAFEMDIPSQGFSALSNEYHRAMKKGEYAYLIQLRMVVLKAKSLFPRYENHKITQMLCSSHLDELLDSQQIMNEAIKRIKIGYLRPSEERFAIADKLQQQVDLVLHGTFNLRYLFLKCTSGIHFLRYEHEKAFLYRKEAIQHLKKYQGQYFAEITQEYSALAMLALKMNNRDAAMQAIFEQSLLPVRGQLFQRVQRKHTMVNAVSVGLRYISPKLGDRAVEILKSFPEEFSGSTYLKYLYFSAIIYWHSEEYSKGIELVNEILGGALDSKKELLWQAEVLLVLLHFGAGNQDTTDYLISRGQPLLKRLNVRFPGFVVDMVKKILVAPSSSHKKTILKRAFAQFQTLVKNPEEKLASDYIDIALWLSASIKGISVVDYVIEKDSSYMIDSFPYPTLGS